MSDYIYDVPKYVHEVATGGRRLDERDQAIFDERVAALDAVEDPRCGDYIEFNDGTLRRISYLWPDSAQTSNGGSFYLGHGHVSFSGSLFKGVPIADLVLTERTRNGNVWFFHHNQPQAHYGVHVSATFRIYTFDGPPTR